MSKNKQLILAIFSNEAAADQAVEALKAWDKATDSIKLGSIGVMVKDENGKVKTEKLGSRAVGRGAGIGVILGLVAAVPTGGLSLAAGAAWGAVGGAIIGAFFHNGLGMSKDDLAYLSGEIDGGKAAVGVLAEEDEAQAVTDKLTELGGTPQVHTVTEAGLEQAATIGGALHTSTPVL